MRKASKIIFLVSSIMSFIYAGVYFLCGTVYVLMATDFFTDLLRQAFNEGYFHSSYESADAFIFFYRAMAIYMVIFFFVLATFSLLNGIFALKARTEKTKKIFILNIVFGVLSNVQINIAGAVLGLIANKRNIE